jgi:CheY-like chemotaxis protein
MRRDDKILVVENNPDFCKTMETGDYAAIVIDADVPHHSGYGVLAYLREEVGEDLRNVIFLTSSSDRDAVRRNYGSQLTVVGKDQAMDEITRVLAG